ncbi:MAG: MBL fold metallo-hydrolase [bacterium]
MPSHKLIKRVKSRYKKPAEEHEDPNRMKLKFLGTRGYIQSWNRNHRLHSSCRVSYKDRSVTIDCGEDWLDRLEEMNPRVLLVTHAHPDHAGGLARGAPCPVYATAETWESIHDYDIREKKTVKPAQPLKLQSMTFQAFPMEHSKRAPAVGYKITAGRMSIFYAPDVVYVKDRKKAFSGIRLYVGDGATLQKSMVRKSGDNLVGHAPVQTQLTWCQKEGVSRAVFTHCGTDIVNGNETLARTRLKQMAEERGVKAELARDGMEITLR